MQRSKPLLRSPLSRGSKPLKRSPLRRLADFAVGELGNPGPGVYVVDYKPLKRSKLKPRGKGLAKVGRRAKREEPALRYFREAIYTRCLCDKDRVGVCEHCGERRRIEPHHLVGRGRAPGWEHLHDPRINGFGACYLCHSAFTLRPELAGVRFWQATAMWIAER